MNKIIKFATTQREVITYYHIIVSLVYMKQSRYNHYIENGDWSYWYNPLYNQFFRLPIELGRKLNSFLDQHVDLGNVSPVFYQKLVDSNFLIEEDVDEIELVRSYYQKAIEKKECLFDYNADIEL